MFCRFDWVAVVVAAGVGRGLGGRHFAVVGSRWVVEVRLGRVWVARFGRSRRVWNCRSPSLCLGWLVVVLMRLFNDVVLLGRWFGVMYGGKVIASCSC